MRKLSLVIAFALAFSAFAPAYAVADSATRTYEFELEVPNVSMAQNGDTVAVTGSGEFSVHPKSAEGAGTFTHTFAGGGSISGTWTADELLEFQSYGCGVVLGNEIPSNLCGGALKMRVTLSAGGMQLPGILTIFCIIGPNPPNSHDDLGGEGITLVVPGILNFNEIVSGMNVFIQIEDE